MAAELQALTGLSKPEAKKLLEANDGDLARAANQFFNGQVATPAPESESRADGEASRTGEGVPPDSDKNKYCPLSFTHRRACTHTHTQHASSIAILHIS